MRASKTRLFPIVLVILLLAPCLQACAMLGGGDPEGITIKVLVPGAEPFVELRHKFHPGQKEVVVMGLDMALKLDVSGTVVNDMTLPTMELGMDVDSREITPEGNLRYEWVITVAKARDNPEIPYQVIDAIDQELLAMIGMSGWGVCSPSGELVEDGVNAISDPTDSQKEIMENMQQQFNQIFFPLPEEPIGKGAMWQVTMPVQTDEMYFTQEFTYWLMDIDGDTGELQVTIKQTAEPQTMEIPGLAEGMTADLESMTSNGSGNIKYDLNNLVMEATMSLDMSMDFTVRQGNQSQRATQTLNLKMELVPEGG
ncbi:DUF6263 family protein [Gemmatimonadota bacterium]